MTGQPAQILNFTGRVEKILTGSISVLNRRIFYPVELLVDLPFFLNYIFFALVVFEENLKMAVLVLILLRMLDYHYELFQKKHL